MLDEGQKAPDFELPDQDGNPVRLSAACAEGPLVLYFYPKDHTAGCTMQACSFRDAGEELAAAGLRVFGVSVDSAETHRSFRHQHGLEFPLLSDPEGRVAEQFGVKKTLGLIPGRATFLIDSGGVIRLAYASQFRPDLHVSKVLETVSRL